MMLCVSGVIGVWGIGFFAPELVDGVLSLSIKDSGMSKEEVAAAPTDWKGKNSILQNTGAFFGMIALNSAPVASATSGLVTSASRCPSVATMIIVLPLTTNCAPLR
jgi:hypothetical protein